MKLRDPVVRFWQNVEKSESCWNWTGRLSTSRYGWFSEKIDGKWRESIASRVSYRLANPGFDTTLCVLHKCDNSKCVRPDHLYLGTYKDNMRDKVSRGRDRNGSGKTKLSLSDERTVRHLYFAERRIQVEIAAFFDRSQSFISKVIREAK